MFCKIMEQAPNMENISNDLSFLAPAKSLLNFIGQIFMCYYSFNIIQYDW